MKHYIYILFTVFFISLNSCNTPQQNEKETLSVSIEPQKYFLEAIVGDKFQVNCVISSGTNPETFDPAPLQMLTLNKSKIYFKVGHLNFEDVWINKVKDNNPSLSIVDCSKGIHIIEHAHCEHEHEKGHGHTGSDPHIWSSPHTAAIMAKNMYDAVIALDPENKEIYTQNLNTLMLKFSETDSIIRSYLKNTPDKSFFIYHPALSYFSEEYGLNQFSIEQEGKSPTPSQLKQLIDFARQNNVKVVFIQEEYDQKNAETIAKEIDAKVVSINLLSYHWSDEMIRIAKSLSAKNE